MFNQSKKSLLGKNKKEVRNPSPLVAANENLAKERDDLKSRLDESKDRCSYLSSMNKDLKAENKELHGYVQKMNNESN